MEERSSSSVSSPTLDDILDSLLALRRPQKKFKPQSKGMMINEKCPRFVSIDVKCTLSIEPIAPNHFVSFL